MPQALLFLTRVFEEKEHAEQFLRGQVRAGTLLSYQEIEDDHRIDPMEGILDSGQIERMEVTLRTPNGYTYTLSHESGERMKQPLPWADRFNILCTTASYVDPKWIVPGERYDEVLDRYVRIPEAATKLGDFVVWIHEPDEFVERVRAAADKSDIPMHYGFVEYGRRPMPSLGLRDVGLIFRKREQYKYDREFRFSFESPQKVEGPLCLDVGDLNDIAKLFKTQEFNDHLTVTCGKADPSAPASESARSWQDDL